MRIPLPVLAAAFGVAVMIESGGTAHAQPAPAEAAPPAERPARLIAPEVVAPPQLAPGQLERAVPRPPLSGLAGPLPPRQEEPGDTLFQPLAIESGIVEAMGMRVTIAGTGRLGADETCVFEGRSWACGMHARTAFRMWLRGRALKCELPPEPGVTVTAPCRLGNQDAAAWLVGNGWARAAPGSAYARDEAAARAAGKGIFGPPPDLSGLPPASGVVPATPPAAPPAPAE